eukprot:g10606.t1
MPQSHGPFANTLRELLKRWPFEHLIKKHHFVTAYSSRTCDLFMQARHTYVAAVMAASISFSILERCC